MKLSATCDNLFIKKDSIDNIHGLITPKLKPDTSKNDNDAYNPPYTGVIVSAGPEAIEAGYKIGDHISWCDFGDTVRNVITFENNDIIVLKYKDATFKIN